MPFDLTNYRTARIFWVVRTRDGRSIPGRIALLGYGPHVDIRVEHDGAPPVTIANADIAGIKAGRLVRLPGWTCHYGFTPGDREVEVWCTRGAATQRLTYRVGEGLGAAAGEGLAEADRQLLVDRLKAVVEADDEE